MIYVTPSERKICLENLVFLLLGTYVRPNAFFDVKINDASPAGLSTKYRYSIYKMTIQSDASVTTNKTICLIHPEFNHTWV